MVWPGFYREREGEGETPRGGMWSAMAPLMTINGGETAPLKRWRMGEAASRRLGGCGRVVQDFGQLVRLHEAGARYIVVANLPDMGKTPGGLAGGA